MSDWLTDLSTKVYNGLAATPSIPPEPVLRRLFQAMYFASLRTEESLPITFHIVYINPDDPDPSPPRRIVEDRWSYVRLANRQPFDIAIVTKLASASDPRSSSLAVYHDANGQLFVWGLVDQGNSYYEFVTYSAEAGPERPGLFQASIVGAGHISVYRGYEMLADFRISELRSSPIDVLERGPISDALAPGVRRYLDATRAELSDEVYEQAIHWDVTLADAWLTALRRLLLRIQQYRHGGALLLTPDPTFADLNIKYQLDYTRLRTCLQRRAVLQVRNGEARDQIFDEYIDADADEIPVDLYLDESTTMSDLDDTADELDGVLWFASLLSRVDGLVLLTPDLEIRGFGVEILTNTAPATLIRAEDAKATKKRRMPIEYNHFGTRHRSMMRYCASVQGSVGFVVSQDGDVRAMTLVGDALVMWDNVKLRLDDFDRRRPRKK